MRALHAALLSLAKAAEMMRASAPAAAEKELQRTAQTAVLCGREDRAHIDGLIASIRERMNVTAERAEKNFDALSDALAEGGWPE